MIIRAFYPLKLRQRLLLVEAAFFVVVLGGVLVTTQWYAMNLRNRIDRERLHAVVTLGGEADRLIAQASTELRLLGVVAEDPRNGNEGWPNAWNSGMFTGGLLAVGGDGRVLATDRAAIDFAGMDLSAYLQHAQPGPAGLRGWAMPRQGALPVMVLAVPITRDVVATSALPSDVTYIVGLLDQVDSALARALHSAKFVGDAGHADLIDSTGVTMLGTEVGHVLEQADHPDFYTNMLSRPEHRPRVAQVAHIEDGVNTGADHVMGFEYLTSLPWAVVLGGDAAQTYAPIRALWYSVGGLVSAFVGVGVVITWLGSEQLVRPIQRLTVAARQVADGELDTQLTAEVGGEVGALADSIDTMRQSLAAWGRELDYRVRARTDELQQRTAELEVSEAVARDASSSLELRPLMQVVAATLEERLEIDGAVLVVSGAGTRTDVVVAGPAVPATVREHLAHCEGCMFAQAPAGWEESPWRTLPAAAVCYAAGFRSAAILPLRAADSAVGTMCLLRREVATPPASALGARFLTLLAAEVGMGTGNALLFDDLRWREVHRRELVAKVLGAQEEERRRLARELHDSTGQSLTALLLGIDAIDSSLNNAAAENREDAVRRRLEIVRSLAQGALSELRKMVLALRPSDLDDLGLVPAISRYAALSASNTGVEVNVVSNLGDRRLSPELEIAVFRIVQEALNNATRHSKAGKAAVSLTRRGADLVVEIHDDGIGFVEGPSGDPMSGVGLDGMRERAALVGGVLQIDSRPGVGTMVRLTVQQGWSIGGLDASDQVARGAG